MSDPVAPVLAEGIPVVCIARALDGSLKVPVADADSRTAGRKARFPKSQPIRQPGRVAVLRGGRLHPSHGLREIGLRRVLRPEFPDREVLDRVSGGDDAGDNHRLLGQMHRECPEVVGAYGVGAGNHGVVESIGEHGRSLDNTLFGHNLTATTRRYPREGFMKAVVQLDPTPRSDTAGAALWRSDYGVAGAG